MAAPLRRSAITIVAVLVLSVLAVGLVEAGVAIGTNATRTSAPLGAAAVATSDAPDPVADEIDTLLAADQTATATPAAAGRVNQAVTGLRRLAAARKLVHATVVVDLPKLGGLTTIQLDHGTITAVSATSLTVSETGGTTATIKLGDETRVRKHGAKGAVADLKTGDEVFVMSKVEGGAAEAYLVVVPKA
jgi:stage V sporulation protein SpoVS